MADSHEWWWLIKHNGHPAWYQRALVAGDFAPGSPLLVNYVLGLDEELPDPDVPLTCGTCGLVPDVNDLDAEERVTGEGGFLEAFRKPGMRWPSQKTDPETCWHCNRKGKPDKKVKLDDVAKRYRKQAKNKTKKVDCCADCARLIEKAVA